MKLGLSDGSSVTLSVILSAAILLLAMPATIHGQDAPVAAQTPVGPHPSQGGHYNLGSLFGIGLVSIGGLMVLSVVARSFRRTRRTKKPYYPPVLFDRLNHDGIVRLQEKINRAPSMRPPTYLYERTEPEPAPAIADSVEETPEQPDSADQPVHAAAAVTEDDTGATY